MDINFTPNTTLSRRIYSFSCTAYEADEFNIKNCLEKYNILKLGTLKNEEILIIFDQFISLKIKFFLQIRYII